MSRLDPKITIGNLQGATHIMKLHIYCLIAIACLVTAFNTGFDVPKANAADQRPVLLDCIRTAPENAESLTSIFNVNHDGDGEGEELPSSIMYFKKDSKDYGTFMTVTDLSLCKRPKEKRICQSFVKMISGASPALGVNVTGTRIGGAGYNTIFLARVDSVKLDGVDSLTAFIGADTQAPPSGEIVLYVYAKKGTNLIQLTAAVGQCSAQPEPNRNAVSYYKRFCVNETILQEAKAKGKMLTELFHLKQ